MQITIKYVEYIFVLCVALSGHFAYSTESSGGVNFSFDQLYPSTSISRALNCLRQIWSLAQDLNDDQYDADNVRHIWLEFYGACDQLVAQPITTLSIPDDITQYIKNVWQLTSRAYDQIQLKDESLGQFLVHMQVACGQMIDKI